MNYQALYYKLFNAFTDIVEALEAQNYGQAKALFLPASQPDRQHHSRNHQHAIPGQTAYDGSAVRNCHPHHLPFPCFGIIRPFYS